MLHPLWFIGGGAITLLLSGVPFRLSQQYWRFSGIEDLVGVAGGSVLSAALFALFWIVTGYPLPTPTFPDRARADPAAVPGRAPRVLPPVARPAARGRAGRAVRAAGRRGGGRGQLPPRAGERAGAEAVAGLLSLGGNQTGRRMQGRPILGGVSELRKVLDGWRGPTGCRTCWS